MSGQAAPEIEAVQLALPSPDAGLVYTLATMGNALKRRDEVLQDLHASQQALLAERDELRAELVRVRGLLDEAIEMGTPAPSDEPEPDDDTEIIPAPPIDRKRRLQNCAAETNGSGDADVRV